jgi:hypothetical protein
VRQGMSNFTLKLCWAVIVAVIILSAWFDHIAR